MRLIYIAFIIFSFSFFSFAQTALGTAQKLDDYFSALEKGKEINGNVLVTENERVIYQKSFGYADFDVQRLNNAESEFNLASISKTFTATAILQLKEKGKLALDDKFAKYFPDFPYPAITVRQLLSHSSGLTDTDLAPIFENFAANHSGRNPANSDLVPLLARAKIQLKLKPGEKWWYCNLGFQLLALLVEKVSGEKFGDYLAKHIFQPAGMNHTYLKTHLINPVDSPNLSLSCDYPFKFFIKRVKLNGESSFYNETLYGHANVVSTTADFLRYDTSLYNQTLLKNETLNETFAATKLATGEDDKIWLNIAGMGDALDGLGWFIFADDSSGKIVWHTGGMPGCATIFFRNVAKKQMVVLFDNTNSEGLYRRGLSAMNILNNKPVLSVKKSLTKIYGRALMEKGADFAAVRLNELKADTENYNLSENDMPNMAYEMMTSGYLAQALETFKLNTFLYLASDNAYESYGEGLLESGKKEEAAKMFKKSLELNPDNEDAKKMLKK